MRSPRQPLFLARQGYRQRRLADASRLLPLVGAVLLVLPLLWRGAAASLSVSGATSVPTSVVGLYLFSVWFVLIAAAALLARRVTPSPGADREGTE